MNIKVVKKLEVKTASECCDSLVAQHDLYLTFSTGYVLFCTISPNPDKQHSYKRDGITKQIPYGRLPQAQQYQYCMKILKDAYLSLCVNPVIVGTAELNGKGNVHFHFLLKDPDFKDDLMLKVYQRYVSLCPVSLYNLHSARAHDVMNNIVHLTKDLDEILEYLDKDWNQSFRRICPNYYIADQTEYLIL